MDKHTDSIQNNLSSVACNPHTHTHTLVLFVFNGHFPGERGLAGTTEAKDDGSVVTTGAVSRAKFQSNCHHQQTNTQLFTGQKCPYCRPSNSVKALKGRLAIYTVGQKWCHFQFYEHRPIIVINN